jgi:hypothetical protein
LMVFRPTGLFHVKHTWAPAIENLELECARPIAKSDSRLRPAFV